MGEEGKQEPEPVLRDINLKIRPKSLNAVIGTIGCGKSSLIMALLKEIPKTTGKVLIRPKSMAYVE